MGSIRININGQDLDLPPDFTIERVQETAIFNRELSKVDFTYPATIALTEKNNAILGIINHLAVANKPREFVADLYLSGIYYNQVTLSVLNVDTNVETAEISLLGTYSSFAREVGSKKLADLYLDGDRVVGTTATTRQQVAEIFHLFPNGEVFDMLFYYFPCDTADHMKQVMEGTIQTDYLFYAAVDQGKNIQWLNDSALSFLNYWDWDSQEFTDPVIDYVRSNMLSRKVDQRLFWVPFFKTLYVIRKCFEELNYTVSGAIFDDPEMQQDTLYNTYTFCKYSVQDAEPDNPPPGGDSSYCKEITNNSTIIHPQDHMPDMTVIDFLNEQAKAWNLLYRIDMKLRTVEIVYFNNIKQSAKTIDVSNSAYPKAKINFDQNDVADGYKLSFSKDPVDQVFGDNQKDALEDYPVVASVDILDDLSVLLPGSLNAFDLAYIRSENAYYQWSSTAWYFYSYNFFDFQNKPDGENPIDISTKVVPVPAGKFTIKKFYIDPSGADGLNLTTGKVLLPCSTIGIVGKSLLLLNHPSYFDASSNEPADEICTIRASADIKIQPHACTYRGQQINLNLASIPYGSVSRISPVGSAMPGKNFFWTSPDKDGLFEDYWESFVNLLFNAIQVAYQILFHGTVDEDFDYESVILRILGQEYLIKQANDILPYPSVSTFQLIRI